MIQRTILVCLTVSLWPAPAAAQQFIGELLLRPQPDGIRMIVQGPFGFRDKRGREWPVAAGFETDGASIPRALWTILGSPFTGKYLPAAVVHDYHCQDKKASWQDVHLVFYDAMIASGVNIVQAKLMYFGVYGSARSGRPRTSRDARRAWPATGRSRSSR